MVLPSKHTARVLKAEFLNDKILRVDFEPTPNFSFASGQYINLKVAANTYRAYSLCSAAAYPKQISIVVSVAHEGVGANFLKELASGEEVEFVGPCGQFGLATNLSDNLIFVGTGTGIAPFMSMLSELMHTDFSGNVFLYFGVRNPRELFFEDVLKSFKKDFSWFDYKLCFSRDGGSYVNCLGRVTDFLEVSENPPAQYYLCGHPDMVTEVSSWLFGKGVLEENVFREEFTHAVK